ncbi:MAG: hypothetical protein BWY95_00867 [Bacteroidetes bacterium ADurb.BinA104]|nr:MAG: hypothetical protein BWY95_00867 [Bacteroidetes bacterium ADurb.BinA104]
MNGIDRADVLASAAAHAEFGLGLGDGQAAFKRNHMNGLDGAVFGAGSATGAVHLYHTDINVEDYATRLCMVFFLYGKRFDGAGGTDLSADVTVIVTVAPVKPHDRLHQSADAVFKTGRFEHVRRTFAYAQMARCAVLQKVLVAY